MMNHFDMAREMARLIDAGKSSDEIPAEMRRMFPMAKAADFERARLIGVERVLILEAERQAAARSLADKWFGGADKSVIDTAIQQYMADRFKPSAETLFPKPDKTKS
jgi:hypothetical protein